MEDSSSTNGEGKTGGRSPSAWLDVFAMSMLNYVRLIAYDRTTQVEVEPCEDNANTDCKSAKYMCAMLRNTCHALHGWRQPSIAISLLDCDKWPTVQEHERPWKEEERSDDENLPWIIASSEIAL